MKRIPNRFKSEVRMTLAATIGAFCSWLTAGKLYNKAYARYQREKRNEWDDHCFVMQAELDAQYKKGYGWRFADGARVNR